MPGLQTLAQEKLLQMYRTMWRIRAFEEAADALYVKGLVCGSIHTSIGQEAVATGVCTALRKGDLIYSSHRGHGHSIAMGAPMDRMMAELLGRKTGLCKGKGGSMHVVDTRVGMLGANGIVGAGIPLATGSALAMKLKKQPNVAVAFFGDGASNHGYFHEGLNMAAIWKLPVVFVCENNGFAITFSVKRSTSVEDISDRARGYGIPGATVDGMDLFAAYEAALVATERARAGQGPSLLEFKTYRYKGHSRGDPAYGPYRTKEEWEEWKQRDAIPRAAQALGLSEAEAKQIEEEARAEAEAASKFAVDSPFPDVSEALDDIYA